jgi:predicted phage baseplate assembly protein
MDDDERAVLRFGDGERGMLPSEDLMLVTYRVGNGPAGNVGAEAINRVIDQNGVEPAGILARNPLPATGGIAPEPVADVKLYAPHVFRAYRERAVTAEDYARAAEKVFGVRRAAADIVQLGALRVVRVAILSRHDDEPSHELLDEVHAQLHLHRCIGHDLQVSRAQMVALDVGIVVGVHGTFLRGHVLAALREALGRGIRRDGRPGLFHPDLMSFGTPVHGSRIVAEAQAVTGVEWVRLTRLRRIDDAAPEDPTELAHAATSILLDRFEVARMDNDSAHPEHGHLEITLVGGR